MSDFNRNDNDSVRAVYLTAFDDQPLSALLVDASAKVESRLSDLLREWREHAHIVPDTVAAISSVSLECKATFIDHEGERVRCTQLIVREDTREGSRVSAMTAIESVTTGVKPDRSVCWTIFEREQRLTILECADERTV
jgi:hypothetical protein